MTRAEAILIASRHNMAGHTQLVDCLVALGLLRLEEPKPFYTLEELLGGVTPENLHEEFAIERINKSC